MDKGKPAKKLKDHKGKGTQPKGSSKHNTKPQKGKKLSTFDENTEF